MGQEIHESNKRDCSNKTRYLDKWIGSTAMAACCEICQNNLWSGEQTTSWKEKMLWRVVVVVVLPCERRKKVVCQFYWFPWHCLSQIKSFTLHITPSTLDIIKLNPTYTLIHTVTEKGRKGHKERGEVYKTTTKICQINMRRYKLTLCNGQQRERRIMSVRSHISFFSHMYILNHDTKRIKDLRLR